MVRGEKLRKVAKYFLAGVIAVPGVFVLEKTYPVFWRPLGLFFSQAVTAFVGAAVDTAIDGGLLYDCVLEGIAALVYFAMGGILPFIGAAFTGHLKYLQIPMLLLLTVYLSYSCLAYLNKYGISPRLGPSIVMTICMIAGTASAIFLTDFATWDIKWQLRFW